MAALSEFCVKPGIKTLLLNLKILLSEILKNVKLALIFSAIFLKNVSN